jgi:hypothetical protein
MLYILASRLLSYLSKMRFRIKVNEISTKKLAILSAALCAVLRKKLKTT